MLLGQPQQPEQREPRREDGAQSKPAPIPPISGGFPKWLVSALVLVLGIVLGAMVFRGEKHPEQAASAPDTPALPVQQAKKETPPAPQQAVEEKKPELTVPPAALPIEIPAAPVRQVGEVFKDCPHCPEMVVIPAGKFTMGSDNGEPNEKPPHRVTIANSFAMGKTEVTQGQWRAVMGSNPPELYFKNCGDDCPVEGVNWDEAQKFIKALNKQTNQHYCLPSEAEWEYACKAGGSTTYCGGENLDSVAWAGGNSENKTHPVVGKYHNKFGLYDMSGNVWEWVQDCYHGSYQGAPGDGRVWNCSEAKPPRVLRGGSWYNGPESSRAAYRYDGSPDYRSFSLGFRVAR